MRVRKGEELDRKRGGSDHCAAETNTEAFDERTAAFDETRREGDKKSAPHLGAFRAVAAHFYLAAGLQEGLPELPVGGALPEPGKAIPLQIT